MARRTDGTCKTRIHSSRMRTARLLTVSQHALMWGVYLPKGDVPAQGGVPAQGVYLPRVKGCTCPQGYLPRYSPTPVNRMTDRCKNITLPQTSFAGGNKSCYLSMMGFFNPRPPPKTISCWHHRALHLFQMYCVT